MLRKLIFGILWFAVIVVLLFLISIIFVSVLLPNAGDTALRQIGAQLVSPLVMIAAATSTFGASKGWLPGTKRKS
jgi:hypothetical protein